MKMQNTPKTVGLATLGLLTLSGALLIPQITPAFAQNSAPRAAEKHPEIRKALANLERAKTALQNAAHDFAGHREKALDLTQQAINEAKLALQADKK